MKKLHYLVSFVVMTLISVSCTSDDIDNLEPPTKEREVHYATMEFNSAKPSFDSEGTTRAVAADAWDDGSKVYLQFSVGNSLVDGVAEYSKSSSSWTIEYYGSLPITNDGQCEAYYFENAGEATYRSVSLTNATAIFIDKSSSYSVEDNTVKVTANLKPMTGRIRMKGSALQEFFLDGVTCYTNYNLESNTFESAAPSIISTTEKDGYSNYIYGFFADEDNRELIFNDKENNVSFVRTFGSNALGVGKSGYLDIPTLDKRSGWTTVKFKDYSIGKVSFRMIRVVGNASYYSFFIGETEVTQALWNAVMNTNLSGDNLPVANVSYNDCLTFIAKLNAKTGENFRLPTASEWFFAAQGGNLTQGYTYSGSNSVAEVAWYSGNSNSSRHDVKTLKPNELEIYDMSGNVSEMTLASGNSFSYYGGYYSDSQNYVKCSSYSSNSSFTSASYAIGLRLLSY